MPDGNESTHRTFQLWGWAVFVVSALFFIAAAVRSGDLLALLGGIFFLAACLLFLVPLVIDARS